MTVKELIELLQGMPQDIQVLVGSCCYEDHPPAITLYTDRAPSYQPCVLITQDQKD